MKLSVTQAQKYQARVERLVKRAARVVGTPPPVVPLPFLRVLGPLARRSRYVGRVWRPNMRALRQLTAEIAALPKSRKLRAGELRAWAKLAERLYRRQQRLERLIESQAHRIAQVEYRLRLGAQLAHDRDFMFARRSIEELRTLLIHQRDGRAANVHAVALGKLAASKRAPLTHEAYAALGRAGARKRWARKGKRLKKGAK